MLAAGRQDSEVYIVPMTLSFQLVLEANTLITDHLEESGKQRFIISDDEFAQPRRVLSFARRVLDLESSVAVHFGQPLDCLGRPVSDDAGERAEQATLRRRYVCNTRGEVEWDSQRDRNYTDRLADGLVRSYPESAWAMCTHIAAYAAWKCLIQSIGTSDPFRLVRAPIEKREIARHVFMAQLRETCARVLEGAKQGRWQAQLPPTAEAVLSVALDRFACYHRSRALVRRGSMLMVEDAKLCLYYRNRLTYIDRTLEA